MSVGNNILKACKARGLSLSRACTLADLRYSTLHSQIANGREIPFTTIDKLSLALNMPLGYFSAHEPAIRIEPAVNASEDQVEFAKELASQVQQETTALSDWGFQIGLEEVLDWLLSTGNRLVKHDWLIEKVDLFYPVKKGDTMLHPYRIGSQSLAARYFSLLETKDYNEVVGKFDRDFLDGLIEAHLDASKRRYAITDVMINETVDGARITGTYRRLLAPVTDEHGQKFMLLFSKLAQFTAR
ncbi:helix-turn-helix transcriptional regulator [Alisedimentitalea sp. MJ-SS2]|uniref:helix-turn-helix domain-containing protein n=1 Tax=Aliisedimentitalea sp. MJ-SS2 TaxID=3049795 RepID=UPI0029062430|nr:helix-turn-helix transcriptional regulator [Alisedimentitalea sp. MJ-SS2]MDU8929608.1 helix-turn-helix transcriptional regulator [Alisedimentitalea sp. MJ-SS2]